MQDGMFASELRHRSISSVIVERVVDSILAGELMPGDKLPTEEEFAARIGVGRSSVREAIKILEAFGIVEIRRADGSYVVDEFKGTMLTPLVLGVVMSGRSAADVIDFRSRVQTLLIDDLVSSPSAALVGECVAMLDAAGDKANPAELSARIFAVESELSKAIPNPLVRELYLKTIQMSRPELERAIDRLCTAGLAGSVFEGAASVLRAVAHGDRLTLEFAIESERNALLAAQE